MSISQGVVLCLLRGGQRAHTAEIHLLTVIAVLYRKGGQVILRRPSTILQKSSRILYSLQQRKVAQYLFISCFLVI